LIESGTFLWSEDGVVNGHSLISQSHFDVVSLLVDARSRAAVSSLAITAG
jgi:hypothetical protein